MLAARSPRDWIALHGPELTALAWWLGPPAALSVLALLTGTRVMDRYTMIGSLAMFPLAAAGIAALPGRSLKLAVIGLVLALSIGPLVEYYSVPRKDGWRETARFIDRRAGRNEPVLFLLYRAEWYMRACFDYYSRNPELDKRTFPVDVRQQDDRLKKCLPPRILEYRRVWLVRLDAASWSRREKYLVEAGYVRTVTRRFSGILVGLWERPPGKPAPRT